MLETINSFNVSFCNLISFSIPAKNILPTFCTPFEFFSFTFHPTYQLAYIDHSMSAYNHYLSEFFHHLCYMIHVAYYNHWGVPRIVSFTIPPLLVLAPKKPRLLPTSLRTFLV